MFKFFSYIIIENIFLNKKYTLYFYPKFEQPFLKYGYNFKKNVVRACVNFERYYTSFNTVYLI